jgi:hypothetical protein
VCSTSHTLCRHGSQLWSIPGVPCWHHGQPLSAPVESGLPSIGPGHHISVNYFPGLIFGVV